MEKGKPMSIIKNSYKELIIGNSKDIEKFGNLYCLLDDIILQNSTFIITDPRGSKLKYYYEELIKEGYIIYNIDITDYKSSNSWNPLDMPYHLFVSGEMDKAKDYLVSMSEEIFLTQEQRRNDEFWGASSANLFVGLAYALFNIADTPSMINLGNIYKIAEDGLESLTYQKNILKYFFEEIYDKDDYARANVNLVINAPNDTRGGILATFFQKMRALVMSENVSNIINQTEIDFHCLKNDKMAIFLNYNPEQFNDQIRLINLFLRQSYLFACDADLPIHFILNDFLGLKYMPYIENIFLSTRKPNVYVFLDSLSLFDKIYNDISSKFLLTQSDQVLYLNRREFFDYSPDYLKAQVSDVDWSKGKENIAIACKNDKQLVLVYLSEYKKKNALSYVKLNHSEKVMYEKYDIKTQVMEHQRQKLLFGKEVNVPLDRSIPENLEKDKRFVPGINLDNETIDSMIQDIDNKLRELDEEERLQNELQEVKRNEEIVRWHNIKRYFFRLILAMFIINILLSIALKLL